jgi:HAD superfamily hydrolase (TIGR01490 family)
MRLAIFDVDGTLVRGSSDRLFWRYLVAHYAQGPRQIAAYLAFLVRYLPTGGIHTLKKNKAYLCGLECADVDALAEEFVATRLMPRLRDAVVQRLRQHVLRGDAVVLLTGTIEPIARALARRLGVRYVSATLCSERGGRYLAQPPETHPFGAAKLSLSRQLAAQIGCELKTATAYGDSHHDLFLLEAVSEPVAVSPDARLSRVALERDWEIIRETDAQRALPR